MADVDRYLPPLSQTPMFRELGHSELRHIAEMMEERRFPAGTTLAESGEAGHTLYLITSGLVRVPSLVGTRASLLMTAPEILGVAAIVPPHRYIATGVADTDCEVLTIPVSGIHALMDMDVSVARRLTHEVAQYLYQRLEEAIADAHGRTIGNYVN
ncbi:MAG: cyclic nucleotide-binding domain-containing protein [Dehalococcoidia bacterium]